MSYSALFLIEHVIINVMGIFNAVYTLRHHPFSTYVKFSEKLTFHIPWGYILLKLYVLLRGSEKSKKLKIHGYYANLKKTIDIKTIDKVVEFLVIKIPLLDSPTGKDKQCEIWRSQSKQAFPGKEKIGTGKPLLYPMEIDQEIIV